VFKGDEGIVLAKTRRVFAVFCSFLENKQRDVDEEVKL